MLNRAELTNYYDSKIGENMKYLVSFSIILLALSSQASFSGIDQKDCKKLQKSNGVYKMKSGSIMASDKSRLVIWMEGCDLRAYVTTTDDLQVPDNKINGI